MREEMRAHARGERREAIVGGLLGLAGLVLAVTLVRARDARWPAAIPLALLGAAQLVSAAKHFVDAGRRRERMSIVLAQEPGRFQHHEIAHAGRVATQLRLALAFDAALLLAGGIVAYAARASAGGFAVGVALAIEGAILLALDLWTSARNRAYLAHLRRFLTDEGARPTTVETAE